MGGAQATSSEALPFDVIDLTPTTVVAYRQDGVDKPSTTSNLSAAPPISVGPGDILKVRIFERYAGNIFPTMSSPGADLGIQRVAENGTINVPFVGTVQVAGLDLRQVEQRIIQQLGNKVQEPEVIVDFAAPRAHTVLVSGDVRKPGRVSILDDIRTVVDAINAAGGPAGVGQTGIPPTNQVEVVVRRQGQVILDRTAFRLAGGRRHSRAARRRNRGPAQSPRLHRPGRGSEVGQLRDAQAESQPVGGAGNCRRPEG